MKPPEWQRVPAGRGVRRGCSSSRRRARSRRRGPMPRRSGSISPKSGITVDYLPLLDVRQPGAHDVIGDRALGSEPMQVAALGPRGARRAGARRASPGCIKHMPGHGRACADSHKELPTVDGERGRARDRSRAVPHARRRADRDDRARPLHRLGRRQPGDAVAVRDRARSSAGGSASTGCC